MLPLRDGVAASTVTLPSDGWEFLVDFLCDKFSAISRDIWLVRFQDGLITDQQGHALPADTRFQAGSIVRYYRALDNETPIPFTEQILFQDEFILAADKPHFLPAVPAGKYLQETLLVRLKRKTGIDSLAPMHRIDRETAGVMLFTIKPETRGAYQSLFQTKQVQKHYHAIAPYRDDLTLPMTYRSRMQESEHFMRMQETAGPTNSETNIALIEQANDLACYLLKPLTGKKHQLRVHMAALGIPIVNDQIYPTYTALDIENFQKPLQLLAKRIEFTDPFSGQPRIFQSNKNLFLQNNCYDLF
ncbi:MAG: pseudouridine synthase [Arenimonas sp.]|nr:pseudouridine synthase [Arenimonas sp.]